MTETINDTHKAIFNNLKYCNKLIEQISVSNNIMENKVLHIQRVKLLAQSIITHIKSNT